MRTLNSASMVDTLPSHSQAQLSGMALLALAPALVALLLLPPPRLQLRPLLHPEVAHPVDLVLPSTVSAAVLVSLDQRLALKESALSLTPGTLSAFHERRVTEGARLSFATMHSIAWMVGRHRKIWGGFGLGLEDLIFVCR